MNISLHAAAYHTNAPSSLSGPQYWSCWPPFRWCAAAAAVAAVAVAGDPDRSNRLSAAPLNMQHDFCMRTLFAHRVLHHDTVKKCF